MMMIRRHQKERTAAFMMQNGDDKGLCRIRKSRYVYFLTGLFCCARQNFGVLGAVDKAVMQSLRQNVVTHIF